MDTWLEVYTTAPEEHIKKIASNHLYQVKAATDITALRSAVNKFKEKFGRNPGALTELVHAGILPSLPRDFDGRDYLYDNVTGEVQTAVIPWKR